MGYNKGRSKKKKEEKHNGMQDEVYSRHVSYLQGRKENKNKN